MSSDLRAILLASVAGAVAGAAVVFYLSPQKSGKASGVRTIKRNVGQVLLFVIRFQLTLFFDTFLLSQ